MLARVIGAPEGRVVAMIGGDDGRDRPAFSRASSSGNRRSKLRAPPHSRRRRGGGRRAVEIDEIGEQKIAVAEPVERGQRRVEQRVVVRPLDLLADAAMGEDVADLADGDDPVLPAAVSRSSSVGSGGGTA